MGKSTISMVIFNSYVSHYQRVTQAWNFTMVKSVGCRVAQVPASQICRRRGAKSTDPLAYGKRWNAAQIYRWFMIIHDYTYSRWLFHVISIVKYSLLMSNYHKLPEGSHFSPLVRSLGDVGRATGCTGPAGSTFFALTAHVQNSCSSRIIEHQ